MKSNVKRLSPGGGNIHAFESGIDPVPEWACHGFELETWHACREELPFTIDSWSGRIRTCRGVGASLEPPEIVAFEAELRRRLAEVSDGAFTIRHWLRLEIYRLQ